MMKKYRQISETLGLGILLAASGGFMDAYSYICRGGVFANAQTGNILLLGIRLSQGEWQGALRYVAPILAFAVGIALADIVRCADDRIEQFHWRQLTVLLEALVLFGVGFIPQTMNLLANSLTSFACGMQVETFRKIHGNGIATTMCIGNLRSGTESLCTYLRSRDIKKLQISMLYYGIIVCFAIGAVVGNLCILQYKENAIFVCSAILLAAFLAMFIDREKDKI